MYQIWKSFSSPHPPLGAHPNNRRWIYNNLCYRQFWGRGTLISHQSFFLRQPQLIASTMFARSPARSHPSPLSLQHRGGLVCCSRDLVHDANTQETEWLNARWNSRCYPGENCSCSSGPLALCFSMSYNHTRGKLCARAESASYSKIFDT